jgi:hypothetical protein
MLAREFREPEAYLMATAAVAVWVDLFIVCPQKPAVQRGRLPGVARVQGDRGASCPAWWPRSRALSAGQTEPMDSWVDPVWLGDVAMGGESERRGQCRLSLTINGVNFSVRSI